MRLSLTTTFLSAVILSASLAVPSSAQTPLQLISPRSGDIDQAGTPTIVVRRPGSYFLPHDLLAADDLAIDVRSSDVTIDLRGHTVLGFGDGTGTGIRVGDVSNVKVFGGRIADFGIGVMIEDSVQVTVRDLQIAGRDLGGSPPDVEIGVLIVDSRGVRVEDNSVSDTFLGIFVRGEASSANRITGNLLAGGQNGELAICYNPAPGADSGGPTGDLVADNHASRYRRGFSFSADSNGNVVRDNTVAFVDLGIVEATAGGNVLEGNIEVEILR